MAGTLRRKVAIELGIIAALTALFLLLFPHRNPALDVGLAGSALLGILLFAGYTKRVVWAASPPLPGEDRFRRCVQPTLVVSLPALLLFLLVGGFLGFRDGGWNGATRRLFDWRMLVVFAAYALWALIQQTLLQLYLLGRLLALFPRRQHLWPILITGLGFSLVHLPDIPTASVTALAGIVWTFLYYRYRRLTPLAISHAALGTAFYYWVCGHDLAREWEQAVFAVTWR
jgi:hypothetical protein